MTSTRTHLLFADSKNRDYPSGNSYVLHLTTLDLVSARVPLLNSHPKLE
jgi:hypothetical protein